VTARTKNTIKSVTLWFAIISGAGGAITVISGGGNWLVRIFVCPIVASEWKPAIEGCEKAQAEGRKEIMEKLDKMIESQAVIREDVATIKGQLRASRRRED
jgi:hypothetical protein